MEDKKAATIDDVMAVVGGVMTAMTKGFKNVNTRFDKVEERIGGIETRLERVEASVVELQERADATQEAVAGLATHMDDQFDGLRAEMASKDFVERKTEMQSTKTHVLVNILKEKNIITSQEATDVIRA